MNNKLLFILLITSGFFACIEDRTDSDQAFVMAKLKKDLAEYKKLKWFDCTNTILLDAEAYVDTFLLVENVNASLEDGLIFPQRPAKPPYIGFIRLDDSTQKKPILNLLELKKKRILERDTLTFNLQ
jgi:hypothetical protein